MTTPDELDEILALQLTIGWAGEGLSDPKRLDCWETDLIDPDGGGDLMSRLFPHTYQWTSLEAARQAAIRADAKIRQRLARPNEVRTLFFWGFETDEALRDRLRVHKGGGKDPMDALPMPMDVSADFDRAKIEDALRLSGQEVDFKVVPGGREVKGPLPASMELKAKRLAAALLPLASDYPAPFFRIEEKAP
jgi:hypothetical protein